MANERYDFSGWATRNDLRCSDGRTIRRDAFKDCDGMIVPLVWQHQHNEPANVLGHALLENRAEGVYTYGTFNKTASGQTAKLLVENGDVNALSIYANQLRQKNGDVLHGSIKEVSLVISGANPGAFIDFPIIEHSGEEDPSEAIIYTGEELVKEVLSHEDVEDIVKDLLEDNGEDDMKTDDLAHQDEKETTVQDVIDGMTEEERKVMYYLVGEALGSADSEKNDDQDDEGEKEMKHNVFESDEKDTSVLQHENLSTILSDAKRYGSLKESFLQHHEEMGIENILYHSTTTYDRFANNDSYGIGNIDYLFPEARSLNNPPDWIKRNNEWVKTVLSGVHRTPFSRIKSMFANITEEDARAKGYITGKMKKEEFFALIKRVTTPQTIYKKQKLDRDDVIDITDFDVVAWLKTEMRAMLDEEIARAILIGDGRDPSSEDKINPLNVRPIVEDEALFTIKITTNPTDPASYKEMIKDIIRSRKRYKGSGSPVFYTTEDVVTEMLLLEDDLGRPLYEDEAALAKKLRVSKIVPVEAMENAVTSDGKAIHGVIVNLNDYNVGADKGGAVAMFDDFDIDYNQMKYLIETRISGALIKPFSAIALIGA